MATKKKVSKKVTKKSKPEYVESSEPIEEIFEEDEDEDEDEEQENLDQETKPKITSKIKKDEINRSVPRKYHKFLTR